MVHELGERLTGDVGDGQISRIFVFEVLTCRSDARKSAQSSEHSALVPQPAATIPPELIFGAMWTRLLQYAGHR